MLESHRKEPGLKKPNFEIVDGKLRNIALDCEIDNNLGELDTASGGQSANDLNNQFQNSKNSAEQEIFQSASGDGQAPSENRINQEKGIGKSSVTRDDFLQNHILSNLQINPSQNTAAFMVNKANLLENRYDSELWIMLLDSKCLRQMNTGTGVKGFIWEGNSLIYYVDKGDGSVFYKHHISENRGEILFSIPMKIVDFILTRDALFFSSYTTEVPATEQIQEGTEVPFFKEGKGIASNIKKSLFSYHLTTRTINKVTSENTNVDLFAFDELSNSIALTSCVGDKHAENRADIFLLNLESGNMEKLSSGLPFCISDIGFIDSSTVVFTGSQLIEYGKSENHEIYTVDISSKEQRHISEEFDKSKMGIAVATDSRFNQSNRFQIYNNQLYFLTVEESSTYLYKTDQEGNIQKLSFESGTIDSFAVTDNGVFFVGLRQQQLQEIYSLKSGEEKKLTGMNDWLEDNRIVIKPGAVHCVNEENTEIDGWVLKPSDFNSDIKYPGILFIHGGPKMVYGDVYFHLMQLLAARGYFVFYCNPRGSDGKGNEFADIRGNFATHAYSDLTSFTDTILEKYGNIDESRLGVIGGSYGGYMVNYIISQTSRYQAAVSEKSMCNLISHFNTSDIGYGYSCCYLGGTTPWDNMDEYLRNSPLTHAKKVKTPTLFIHGKDDLRCNYTESLQMYSAISYFGTEAKLCILEEENHFFESRGKPLTKIKRFNEILAWFDRYLNAEY